MSVTITYKDTEAKLALGESKKLACNGMIMSTDVDIVEDTVTQSKTATGNGTITPDSGKLLSSVVVSVPVYDGSLILPIGGRIFYIGADNGATYHFYDNNYVELTTITVAGLANACYYSISGTPSADKFYVYDSTNGLATDMEWGAYSTFVGIISDGIGLGKTNTATALANSDCFTPYTSGNTTIWKYLRDSINANSVGGCNDWFIGSEAEQDQLRSSGLVDWYSSNYIWSSVENSSSYAYLWYYYNSYWNYSFKFAKSCVVPLRAF